MRITPPGRGEPGGPAELLGFAGRGCPLGGGCEWVFTYPEGYQDPLFDGTVAGFGEVVLPARRDALLGEINGHLRDHGITGLQFAWQATP